MMLYCYRACVRGGLVPVYQRSEWYSFIEWMLTVFPVNSSVFGIAGVKLETGEGGDAPR